ncbi:hypothetical protein RD792_001311 [Penstemon davidsonii]|uniref:Uncharacterized protein n=1 Tax=Penstemon davidsonii TaxID=160366 RepID=A0ABR0DN18_9LAMI|nr:hypothetical protein RD792_001311 [Penstemon davidsonii]
MGGLCSKPKSRTNLYAGQEKVHHQKQQVHSESIDKVVMAPPTAEDTMEKKILVKESPRSSSNISDDEFYDGIPRYRRSMSLKSRSFKVAKSGLVSESGSEEIRKCVAEVSSLLGRAGSVGLERAVDVLDTLGSSVTNLNLTGGFAAGPTAKNNELSILSFEVANTIVKGSNLMQSLSTRSIIQLKEVVLPTEGIRRLISEDMDELLRIVAADKREELKVFSGEVIRFGNRCKDSQWHNLDRFFEKRSRDRTPQRQLREVAESMMMQLMTSVQLTADLYQKLNTLDKLEQDYQRKRLEEFKYNAAQRGDRDNSVNVLASDLKNRRKLVKNLKKKSLWSRSMEEVMEKLVDIVLFLNQEISNTFGNPEDETPEKESSTSQQKLGPAGLSLHYANIILQIDSVVARSSTIPQISRDTLYDSLPPNMIASLRSNLRSFQIDKELTVTKIKNEMEKTLHWLVPVAINTAKAHHGFGWVGEWGNTGSELNGRTVGPNDVMKIETLHHADRMKTESYIIDLLLWLNNLVNRYKSVASGGSVMRPTIKTLSSSTKSTSSTANEEFLQDVKRENKARGLSSGCDSGLEEEKMEKRSEDGSTLDETRVSGNTFVDLGLGDEKSWDVIDRVDVMMV